MDYNLNVDFIKVSGPSKIKKQSIDGLPDSSFNQSENNTLLTNM